MAGFSRERFALDHLEKQNLRCFQLASNRFLTYSDKIGNLLVLQSDKEPEFHDLGLLAITHGEDVKRLVDLKNFFIVHGSCKRGILQFHSFPPSSPLEPHLTTGIFHKDAPHGL